MRGRKISRSKIRQAALKIASAVRPEKIILFGSYAYGRPNEDSDVDLLLIVRQKTQKQQDEVYDKASGALSPRVFPVDLVVRSKKDIGWRVRGGGFFPSGNSSKRAGFFSKIRLPPRRV